ncbi:hypothetical protein EBU95_02165 [bacterium]|nr:hypothetical protein [bacterium]
MLFNHIVKGIILAYLYLEVTNANDTTIRNTLTFLGFYLLMVVGAVLAEIDTNVITSAFLTKCVFTIVDTQIKKPESSETGNN